MVWLALSHIFSTILELVHIGRMSDKDKDLEIIVLRHQLDVMTRLQTANIREPVMFASAGWFVPEAEMSGDAVEVLVQAVAGEDGK